MSGSPGPKSKPAISMRVSPIESWRDKRSRGEESQSSSGSAYKAPERLADRRSTSISMSRMWTLFSNEHWRQALRNVSPVMDQFYGDRSGAS